MQDDLTKVQFTNLQKILYPKIGVKKLQVVEYYIRIAPKMLYFLMDRAIVMNRFPDGVDKEGFYEKDASQGVPEWIDTFKKYSETADRDIGYVVGGELDTLIWLANMAAVEINIMLSKTGSYENPDLVFIDLDPEPPADFVDAVTVASILKEDLDSLGLKSFVKTSGKKGLHIVLPVLERYSFKETREFVHILGKHVARGSEKVVSEFSQGRDPGKVFVDYTLNHSGKTMIAPYSLRAEESATVSTPLDWKDVRKGLNPLDFNIFNVPKISESPWEGLFDYKQKLEVKKENGQSH
jgi:bifunctional non-homologous end joining protein LigD